jgi:Initiation factor 2 subunit family
VLDHLYSSRPTAVNLGAAIRRLSRILDDPASSEDETYTRELAKALIKEGRLIADEDVGRNHEMSRHGADWVFRQANMQDGGKVNVLTVCNTGSLATSVCIRSHELSISMVPNGILFCRRDMELHWVSLLTCTRKANLKKHIILRVHPTIRVPGLLHSSCNL